MGMRDLANHIIAVANERKRNITNLQLQKVMFFIFGRLVNLNGSDDQLVRRTYDMHFRRWSYGPVIEEIYFDYNHFGGRPIIDESVEIVDVFSQFDDNIDHLLTLDPFKMVEITHKLPSWADYKEDIEARNYVPPYEIEDFEREFGRREQ